MKIYKYIITVLLIFWFLPVDAQFYTIGNDPGNVKWSQIETEHYKVIYPRGLDSLSTIYAQRLEQYWAIVGQSAGFHPGEFYNKKTPIVIHAFNGEANGSVIWAPMRMNLFTVPQSFRPGPMPWTQSLAVHESRHVSQMQFGKANVFKPFNWFLGEMFSGAMSAVYPNVHLLEGDAVVTETALTKFGRGRQAEFLNFYMSAFAQGDYRNWYRWRYGTYGGWVPNHYALGYLTVAGARYLYDEPLFMQNYFQSASKKPWKLFHLQKNIKKSSNLSLNESFENICKSFNDLWVAEAEERAPFIEYSSFSQDSKWFNNYNSLIPINGKLYALKSGSVDVNKLVCLNKNQESKLKTFSYNVGDINYSSNKLWWNEVMSTHRWDLKMNSKLRYMDLETGKIKNFTNKGRYFNPAPNEEGTVLTAVEYPLKGKSNIVQFDIATKSIIKKIICPDSLQVVEAVGLDNSIFFSAISDNGTGIYMSNNNGIKNLVSPLPISINKLSIKGDDLFFISDRTGVKEFYSLDTKTGKITQKTSLRYGGHDFVFNEKMDSLYFTVLSKEGNKIQVTSSNNLLNKEVDFSKVHKDKVAEKLTSQERLLANENNLTWPDKIDYKNIKTSEPRPYRKITHIPNFHSWAPIYVEQNSISALSYEDALNKSGLGATAFFQNVLGTAYGSVGYLWDKDKDLSGYRNSLHLQFTYTGLFPVFSAELHYGERNALEYRKQGIVGQTVIFEKMKLNKLKQPSLYGKLRTYIPLDFSSSGWNRGVLPIVTYTFTNDVYRKDEVFFTNSGSLFYPPVRQFYSYKPGKSYYNQSLDVALRLYTMQSIPSACEYPKYGISGEVGYHTRIGIDDLYTASYYIYSYGYLPGILANQGIRLSAKYQHQFESKNTIGENNLNMTPRGVNDDIIDKFVSINSSNQFNFSIDYSIPFSLGDISALSPIMYIKNFTIKPYFDYTYLKMKHNLPNSNIYSVGSEFLVNAGNFFWLPYNTTLGISACYNGGDFKDMLTKNGRHISDHYIGLVFKIKM